MEKPTVVCLCGSGLFIDAFEKANLLETIAGNIVLSIGVNRRHMNILVRDNGEEAVKEIKERLDELHLRKIDIADEVLILNVDGYIGESTQKELHYAERQGKRIRFLEEPN